MPWRKAHQDWEAFFATSSSMGLGLQVAALDDFSEQAIAALRTVRITMFETKLMKSIKISSKPANRARALTLEYAEESGANLLDDIGEPVRRYLLEQALLVQTGMGYEVADEAPGGQASEKKDKDKKDKKKHGKEKDSGKDGDEPANKKQKKDKKHKE